MTVESNQLKVVKWILSGISIATVLLSCGITMGMLFSRVSYLEETTGKYDSRIQQAEQMTRNNRESIAVINSKLDYISKGIDAINEHLKTR